MNERMKERETFLISLLGHFHIKEHMITASCFCTVSFLLLICDSSLVALVFMLDYLSLFFFPLRLPLPLFDMIVSSILPSPLPFSLGSFFIFTSLGDMGDHHIGLQARLMSQALRKLTANISRSKCIVIFINQIRMKVGVLFGSPETTPGGNALKFYSSVRLDIRKVLYDRFFSLDIHGGGQKVVNFQSSVHPDCLSTPHIHPTLYMTSD